MVLKVDLRGSLLVLLMSWPLLLHDGFLVQVLLDKDMVLTAKTAGLAEILSTSTATEVIKCTSALGRFEVGNVVALCSFWVRADLGLDVFYQL